MVDQFDMDDDLPVSSGAGWLEMKAMLDSRMPVKKRSARPGTMRFVLFTSIVAVFLFSSLHLGEDLLVFQSRENNLAVSPATSTGNILFVPAGGDGHVSKYRSADAMHEKGIHAVLAGSNESDFAVSGTSSQNRVIEKIPAQVELNDISINKARGRVIKNMILKNRTEFSMTTTPNRGGLQTKPWQFAAGIGMNSAAGKKQYLQPYPVAEMKYHLNTRFYIAAGLAVFSPAPAAVSGVTKTVYVNDTANNIRLYNEVINYDRLRYADLPLSVGVNISKKISFQAGFQASLLLSKNSKQIKQPYDFQMNNINFPVDSPAGMAANPQQNFNVQVRKMDYRFVAGIKYHQGKMIAGLAYQYGLNSPGTGMNASGERNQFFTLNLLYNIK